MAFGDWDKVGDDDAFAAAEAACFHDGFIWASSGGKLSRITPSTGVWEGGDSGEDFSARLIVAFNNKLWIVKQDGTPHVFDPSTGSVEAGLESAFAAATHAVGCGDRLFAIANNMIAYYEDSGDWQPTDGLERSDVLGLVENGDAGFYLLDSTGMHHVTRDGEVSDVGDPAMWTGTQGFTRYEGKLYFIAENGNIYGFDPGSGEKITVSESGDWTTKYMFACEGALYIVSYGGTIFRCFLS
jgi:hypothetical protein